jgi:hypothetical protein
MSNTSNHPLSETTINQMIKTQEKEIEARIQEIEFRKQSEQNNYEYGKQALAANERDRESQRNHTTKSLINSYIFYGIIVFLILVFLSLCIFLNKDQLVSECIKAILYIGTGGLGGFGLAKMKKDPSSIQQNK